MYSRNVKVRLERYYVDRKYEEIDKLLGKRCNVDFVGDLSEMAIGEDDLRLMEVLFKHDPESVKGKLWAAVCYERGDIVDFLLLHQADTKDCLVVACDHEYDDIFDKILPAFLAQGEDINAGGSFDNPLLTACRYGSVSKVNKLYLHGADINVVDENGENALFYCYYQPECLELLINYGIRMTPNNNGIYPNEVSNSQECLQILHNMRQ